MKTFEQEDFFDNFPAAQKLGRLSPAAISATTPLMIPGRFIIGRFNTVGSSCGRFITGRFITKREKQSVVEALTSFVYRSHPMQPSIHVNFF